jgi:DNA polymerase III sliding clamp (beta) subunit (PCNA family)
MSATTITLDHVSLSTALSICAPVAGKWERIHGPAGNIAIDWDGDSATVTASSNAVTATHRVTLVSAFPPAGNMIVPVSAIMSVMESRDITITTDDGSKATIQSDRNRRAATISSRNLAHIALPIDTSNRPGDVNGQALSDAITATSWAMGKSGTTVVEFGPNPTVTACNGATLAQARVSVVGASDGRVRVSKDDANTLGTVMSRMDRMGIHSTDEYTSFVGDGAHIKVVSLAPSSYESMVDILDETTTGPCSGIDTKTLQQALARVAPFATKGDFHIQAAADRLTIKAVLPDAGDAETSVACRTTREWKVGVNFAALTSALKACHEDARLAKTTSTIMVSAQDYTAHIGFFLVE